MFLYKKVLVLMDCSSVDSVIVEHIKKLAKVHKSQVHFFHVVHVHTLDQQRIAIEETKNCLAKAKSTLEKAGLEASFSFAEGEPAEEILKKINETNWDLIAMATHGHKGISDFISGSISNVIKHNTDKPILLIMGKIKK